jgi:SAM-dependent methyltransferase
MGLMNENRQDAYSTLSRYYDMEFDAFDADLEMYRQFAEHADGPVLELGCGSGRVLSYLQDLDAPLTGIDTSESMLAIARDRLGTSVSLHEMDMRFLDGLEAGPYALAFSAINTFLHMPDIESQLLTLTSMRSRMLPDGMLLLDLLVPQPDYLMSLDGRLEHEFTTQLADGTRLDKWALRTHDLASQTIYTTLFYDTISVSGAVTRHVDRYTTRYIHHVELEHLLARAGWEIVSLFASYDLHPFDSESERMIVLATPAAGVSGQRGEPLATDGIH